MSTLHASPEPPVAREDDPTGSEDGSTPPSGIGPSLFLLLIVAQPAISLLASGLFDSVTTVVDSSWRQVTIVEGNTARNVQILFMLAISGLAVHLLLEALRRPAVKVSLLAVAGTVGALLQMLRGGDASELLGAGLFVLALWAASVSTARHQAMRWLGWFAVFFWITNWLFVGYDSDAALKECRADKCSFLGSILQGYVQHEQTLALYTALFLPTLAFLPRAARYPAVLLGLTSVVATGSRTGMATTLLALVAFALLRQVGDRTDDSWRLVRGRSLGQLASLLPLAALLVGLGLFLLLPPAALTGRGQIWKLVREAVALDPIFGPGRGAIEHGYAVGDLDFVAWTEHNQAGYLLAVGGVVVLTLFLLGLLQHAVRCWQPEGGTAALVMIAPVMGLLTEVVWSFDLLGGSTSWTLLLCILLQPKAGAARHDLPLGGAAHEGARRRWRLLLGGALVGLIVSLLTTYLGPKEYVASTELFVSRDSTDSVLSAADYARERSRSLARTIDSPAVIAPALAELGRSDDPSKVAARVTVEVPFDTVVLRIQVQMRDAQEASQLAAALSEQAAVVLPELDPHVRLTPLQEHPPAPVLASRGVPTAAVEGLILGLLGGWFASSAARLSRGPRSGDTIRRAFGGERAVEINDAWEKGAGAKESYRRAWLALRSMYEDGDLTSVAVVSPHPGLGTVVGRGFSNAAREAGRPSGTVELSLQGLSRTPEQGSWREAVGTHPRQTTWLVLPSADPAMTVAAAGQTDAVLVALDPDRSEPDAVRLLADGLRAGGAAPVLVLFRH